MTSIFTIYYSSAEIIQTINIIIDLQFIIKYIYAQVQ